MSKARTSLKCDYETDYETSEHNPNTIRITLVQNPPQSLPLKHSVINEIRTTNISFSYFFS